MPSIAWTKEFKGTGRCVLFGSDFVLLQLGPEDRWRHEGNYSFLDGEEGEPEVRCFALDGRPLWFRKDARLLAILPGDRVLITESDEVLIVVDADGHVVTQRKCPGRITHAAVDGDSLTLSAGRQAYLADCDLTIRHQLSWPGKGAFHPDQWIGDAFYWVDGYQLMTCKKDGRAEPFCPSFRDAVLHAAKCFEPQVPSDSYLMAHVMDKVVTRGLPPEMWNLSSDPVRGLLFLTSPCGPHFAICVDRAERRARWCEVLSAGCCGGPFYCLPDGRYVTSSGCGDILSWLDAEGNVLARAELLPGEAGYGSTLHLLANGRCVVNGGPGMISYGPDSKRIWTLNERFSMLAIHPAKTSAAGFYFPGGSIKQPVSTVLKVLTDL